MKVLPVTDERFHRYGQIIEGYDLKELLDRLDQVTPLPEGTAYVPNQPELYELPAAKELADGVYGGMPIQLGWCNGHNTRLNCLEYHRDSELNLGTTDFILLLAKREDMADGRLDTRMVEAFYVPAGVLVEVYATTLHYAPCSAKKDQGFKVLVVLPWGTNGPKTPVTVRNAEDRILTACNKWLLAHGESSEAAGGAEVRLDGVNIDISDMLET